METFSMLINALASLLARCGVTPERSVAVALCLLYLLVTLVVLGFLAAVLWRGRRVFFRRAERSRIEVK